MRKALFVAVILATFGILCHAVPAVASEAVIGLKIERSMEPKRLILGPGGSFLMERYVNLGKPAIPTHADSSMTWGVVGTQDLTTGKSTGGPLSHHAATTIKFTSAQNDSLFCGGVPARTLRLFIYARTVNDIAAGTIVVTGKNAAGATITENITITSNTELTAHTVNAYSNLTTILFPIQDAATEDAEVRYNVGRGSGIGLPFTTTIRSLVWTQYSAGGTGAGTTASTLVLPTITDTLGVSNVDIEKCFYKPLAATWSSSPPTGDYDILYWIPPYQGNSARTKW